MIGTTRWICALAAGLTAATAINLEAESRLPKTIEERARGAERVVVASIGHVASRFERNEFGDELIVSDAALHVEEAIKGGPDAAEPVTLTYEGGTVNGLTMRVSSLPVLSRGERAVFFLERGDNGSFKAHLKGHGILKLDRENRVPNSSLTLDDIRRMAGGNGR